MSDASSVAARIDSTNPVKIGVVGLGYTGLPLANAFAEMGFGVIGYDIDEARVDELKMRERPRSGGVVPHDSRPRFTAKPDALTDCAVVFISVPTPVTDDREPDTTAIRSAGRIIGANIAENVVVVLQSTIYPGGTREELVPAIEEASGWTAGEEFTVGYAPERLSPGEETHELGSVVKVVAADDDDTRQWLVDLFETIIDVTVYPAETIEAAEAAKCLENVQRDVNIALVNEFAMACDGIEGLDPYEVFAAAETKWNFQSYRPGMVNGHCIPVDPHYLIHCFEMSGFSPELVETARNVNDQMSGFVADLVEAALTTRPTNDTEDTSPRGRVLVLGLAYKPGAEDVRSPTTARAVTMLCDRDFDVIGYDPHAARADLEAAFDIPIQDTLDPTDFDALLVLTPHEHFEHLYLPATAHKMADHPVLVDPFRAFDPATARDSGFTYRRL